MQYHISAQCRYATTKPISHTADDSIHLNIIANHSNNTNPHAATSSATYRQKKDHRGIGGLFRIIEYLHFVLAVVDLYGWAVE